MGPPGPSCRTGAGIGPHSTGVCTGPLGEPLSLQLPHPCLRSWNKRRTLPPPLSWCEEEYMEPGRHSEAARVGGFPEPHSCPMMLHSRGWGEGCGDDASCRWGIPHLIQGDVLCIICSSILIKSWTVFPQRGVSLVQQLMPN